MTGVQTCALPISKLKDELGMVYENISYYELDDVWEGLDIARVCPDTVSLKEYILSS